MASPLPGNREYIDAIAPFVGRQRAMHMIDALSLTLRGGMSRWCCSST